MRVGLVLQHIQQTYPFSSSEAKEELPRPGSILNLSAGPTARTKLCRGNTHLERTVKSFILATAILVSISPAPSDSNHQSASHDVGERRIEPTTMSGTSSFIDICTEIVARQMHHCSSQCAAQGKTYTFESTICGINSKCKCG